MVFLVHLVEHLLEFPFHPNNQGIFFSDIDNKLLMFNEALIIKAK